MTGPRSSRRRYRRLWCSRVRRVGVLQATTIRLVGRPRGSHRRWRESSAGRGRRRCLGGLRLRSRGRVRVRDGARVGRGAGLVGERGDGRFSRALSQMWRAAAVTRSGRGAGDRPIGETGCGGTDDLGDQRVTAPDVPVDGVGGDVEFGGESTHRECPGPRSRRGQGRWRPCRPGRGRSVDRCWSWCRSSDVVPIPVVAPPCVEFVVLEHFAGHTRTPCKSRQRRSEGEEHAEPA